ncbi:type IV secretion system protein [Luteimonas gilva]|uniref:Type IV secretion system protein n=1 Tax=Luteimonas gilva TaxID=2572684 RepID=A0A4U5JN39_9GAMM|nr:type IV secretion system protein [Luteimonas gilva]TKR30186.1 type IV secretion system protein [Luteimonas gilva]
MDEASVTTFLFDGFKAFRGGPLDDASGYVVFRVLYEHLDGMVRQFGIDLFGRFLTWVGTAATTLLTLWFLVEGFQILIGRSQRSMTAFVTETTQALVITTIATGACLGGGSLYEWVDHDLGQMVHRVITGQTGDVFEGIDRMLGYMQMAFGFIDEIQAGDNGALLDAKDRNMGFVAVGMGGPAIVAGALLLMYKLMLALCLGFAPLFVLCLLFPQTKALFWGWLNHLVGVLFALSVLHVMAAIAVNMICAVAATFWTAKLTGASVEGINSLAMQQGGLGLILTTLIIGAPAAAAKFFKGLLGDFNPYSAFGQGAAAHTGTAHAPQPHMHARSHTDPGERQQAPVQTHAHRVPASTHTVAHEDRVKPAEDTRSFLERYPNATASLDNRTGTGDSLPAQLVALRDRGAVASTVFGDKVDRLIGLSATLQQDLLQLQTKHWKIVYGAPDKGSITDRSTDPPSIIIDGRWKGNDKETLRALVHEIGHASYPYKPDYSSREAYIRGALCDEAAAMVKNIQIRREILESTNAQTDIGLNGTAVNHEKYNAAYDQYLLDKDEVKLRTSIGNVFGDHEYVSVRKGAKKSYREYYGEEYDLRYGR